MLEIFIKADLFVRHPFRKRTVFPNFSSQQHFVHVQHGPIRWICWFQNRFEKIQVSITSQAANTSVHLAKFNVKADNKSLNLQRFLSPIRVEKKERGKKIPCTKSDDQRDFMVVLLLFFWCMRRFIFGEGERKHGRDRRTIWYGFDLQKHDLEDLQCLRD